MNKKYIKKVLVTGEESSAEARAERLRKLRNFSNLDRKKMCNIEELKLNTYKGWELGRFGGLPLDGAARVIERVAQENVVCSLEWLLYGRGQEPYILPTQKASQNNNDLILKEIMLFQSFYPKSIYAQIQDDALTPHFQMGDYVAGIKVLQIDEALNQVCIVGLINDEIVVRYLKSTTQKNEYHLLATNLESQIEPYSFIAPIKFAAPISRYYQKNK